MSLRNNRMLELTSRAVPPGSGRNNYSPENISRGKDGSQFDKKIDNSVPDTCTAKPPEYKEDPRKENDHPSSSDSLSAEPGTQKFPEKKEFPTSETGNKIIARRSQSKLSLKAEPRTADPIKPQSSTDTAEPNSVETSAPGKDASLEEKQNPVVASARSRTPRVQLKSSTSLTKTATHQENPENGPLKEAPEIPEISQKATAARKPKVQLKGTGGNIPAAETGSTETKPAATAARKPKVQLKRTGENTPADNVAEQSNLAESKNSEPPNEFSEITGIDDTASSAQDNSVNLKSAKAELSELDRLLVSLDKNSLAIRENILEYIHRQGKPSKVILEPLGDIGLRLVLIGKDGIFGDQVVSNREQAQIIIDSLEFLDVSSWDRKTTSELKIMPYHWYKMAGWVARSHHFPKYKKKSIKQKKQLLTEEKEEIKPS